MLSVQVFTDSSLGEMLADLSARINDGGDLSLSTNRHGFASLDATFIPMSLSESFAAYEWPGTPHVVVSDQSTGVVWEGRLEDIAIVDGGISLSAFGYQRALSDMPYTALWSKSGSADWRPVTTDEAAAMQPDRYEMDNNNRLYIAPRKGENYNNQTHIGAYSYAAPHGGNDATLATFACSYSMTLPAGWEFRVQTRDDDFANAVVENTVTATGVNQTGTLNLTLTAKNRIVVEIRNNTGGASAIAADTGTWFLKLTSLRLKNATTATITAGQIAAALAAAVSNLNSSQLAADAALIGPTTTDMLDELYEDEWPAAILDRLGILHGYQWSVWEDRRLTFQAVTTAPRAWYVDVGGLELQRSLDRVRNSAYAVYRDAAGRTLRTATIGNTDSQARYGIIRRGFVSVQTTSLSEAQTHRGVWLTDHANMQARARIEFDRVYDATGAPWPLYAMRAGDTVTLRNLPPTLSTGVDRIRTFTIGETDYDAAGDSITIAPDDPIPTLVTLVARREAGL